MVEYRNVWINDERRPTPGRQAVRMVVIAIGVVIAAHTSRGISYHGPGSLGPNGWGTLALVVVALTLFNMVLKPLLVVFTLPFVLVTFGLGLWVINALLFLLAGAVVPGFEVASFASALWGALVVSAVSLLVYLLLGPRRRSLKTRVLGGVSGGPPSARRDRDVIDL